MPSVQTLRRREVLSLGADLKDRFGAIRKITCHVGTWLDRDGTSLCLHLDSKAAGRRFVIHKWADEEACSVRLIRGDFWRDPSNAIEYAEAVDVVYSAAWIAVVLEGLLEANHV